MPSPIRQTSSISPPKIALHNTQNTSSQIKNTNTTFINIPDDVLPVFYNNLNLKQIMNMSSLNKSFNSKKVLSELETLDLTNIIINIDVLKFIEGNFTKSKINKIILDKNLHYYQINNMYYELKKIFKSQKMPVFEIDTLDLTNVTINTDILEFINNNINKFKIKKLIFDNISFENDNIFELFIEQMQYYENVEELVINNFNSVEGKQLNSDPNIHNICYLNDLVSSIGFLTNLKKLTLTNTNIIEETEWDITEDFKDVFIEMLNNEQNLEILIFKNNNIEQIHLLDIIDGIHGINKQLDKIEKSFIERTIYISRIKKLRIIKQRIKKKKFKNNKTKN
jgi:hypothetical protein